MKKAAAPIIASLNLVMLIAYLIFCGVKSHIPSQVICIAFIISFALSLVFILIKKIPNFVKIIISSILVIFTFSSCFFLSLIGGYIEFKAYEDSKAIQEYEANKGVEQFDDDITYDYGNYEDIAYYTYLSTGIFQQEAKTLICKYDDTNFENKVNSINSEYKFFLYPVDDEEPKSIFTHNGFNFRLIMTDTTREWYPKEMHFIGINNDTNEVAYVVFNDSDLDSVWDYHDLIEYDCGWKYIKR